MATAVSAAAPAADLKQHAETFRTQVQTALEESDDPLQAYIPYVQWTATNEPEHLVELLREVTSAFASEPTYKYDLRYLKAWTLFASYMDDPLSVYTSLIKNDIGTTHAHFWEEYAACLAKRGEIAEADQAFQTGIDRKCRPLERLKSRYAAFKSAHPIVPSSSVPRPAAQAAPGRRQEVYQFDVDLLLDKDSVESCIQEARARYMGLLGKTWAPLVSEEPVKFDGQQRPPTRSLHRNPDSTVTVNTKAAMEDVYGMYSSPDRSLRFGAVGRHGIQPVQHTPASKIAATPTTLSRNDVISTPRIVSDENANRTPAPSFTPFVDEPQDDNKTPAPLRSRDGVENKTPFGSIRKALAVKDATAPALPAEDFEAMKPKKPPGLLDFSKVFTPAVPVKRVLESKENSVESLFSPAEKKTLSRTTSNGDASSVFNRPKTPTSTFTPFVDSDPGKLPSQTPNPSSPPFESIVDPQPVLTQMPEHPPPTYEVTESVQEDQEVQSDVDDDLHEGSSAPQRQPWSGRLGHFNVMTPITERTFELTQSTRLLGTPTTNYGGITEDPVQAAEQLAAELRAGDAQDLDSQAPDLVAEFDDSFEQSEPGFRISDGHTIPLPPSVADLENRTTTLTLSDAIATASAFKPPNPCIPSDAGILRTLLSLLPLDNAHFDLRPQCSNNRLSKLQSFAQQRTKRRASGDTSRRSITSEVSEPYLLELGADQFEVQEKLGEGGFGAVFRARFMDMEPAEDSDSEDEGEALIAIKVIRPAVSWEYHALKRAHSALPPALRRSVIEPQALYTYTDESFLLLELRQQGTLLDLVNKAGELGIAQQGACLDELLVMFFTVELLRLLEGLHEVGIIHGDVKIDNCLVRLEDVPGGLSSWSAMYSPQGQSGWACKGIKLIDFGRAIDTRLFPLGQQFVGDWETDVRDCLELRQGKPWTYHNDYYGLAGIVYCMLFGKYIESVLEVDASSPTGQRSHVPTSFKRYWQVDLWSRLFDMLLNPGLVRTNGSLPLVPEIRDLRVEMERWLQKNCNKANNTLKGLLKKVEKMVLTA